MNFDCLAAYIDGEIEWVITKVKDHMRACKSVTVITNKRTNKKYDFELNQFEHYLFAEERPVRLKPLHGMNLTNRRFFIYINSKKSHFACHKEKRFTKNFKKSAT